MKSFPSTLNESQNMYGSTRSQSYTNTFDIERLKSLNLTKNAAVINTMLNDNNINISNYQSYPNMTIANNPNEIGDGNNEDNKIYYENPLELPSEIIALAKDYDWVYKNRVKSIVNFNKTGNDSGEVDIANTSVAPSMFNPMYGISILGITRNTPLINDTNDYIIDGDISDCSIRTLCALSKHANSPLGQARYKYADFMYCKDLGKVANNHLITLRKFAHPVGDHIFEMTNSNMISGNYSFKTEGDVGRLVTWFGTDDNRLEDICKFSYNATWKELESQIDQLDSTADDETSGIVGLLSNSFNPAYSEAVNAGEAGNHSIWGWLGSNFMGGIGLQGIGKNNGLLRNYDNNKVYTPLNTIQSTNIYEGKLIFSHEFTLNFSYKLRAYDNINPRSALTDLIGNILEVTYRRGKFWGGDRKIIGPAQNLAPFDKVSKFIDNAFDETGGFMKELMSGGLNMQDLLGKLGSLGKNIVSAGRDFIEQITSGQLGETIKNWYDTSGAASGLKGLFKNALGRPTLYAWQSLLSGDDVGLWHVTIGNPRNPILAMGNLIMTNAQISHSGPLGIDDFPSELKLSVTLKHARPRDITEIGRMYTKGAGAIYHTFAHHNLDDFFGAGNYAKISGLKADAAREQIKKGVAQDIKTYNQTVSQNNIANDSHLSTANPFLTNESEIKIMRTNNWSDTMFSVSMQEVA